MWPAYIAAAVYLIFIGAAIKKKDGMYLLYGLSFQLFLGPLLLMLVYSAALFIGLGLPLRLFSSVCQDRARRFIYDKKGVSRYRGWGWKIGIYARNIALSLSDQGMATILGQAPDISISEALGLAMLMHELGHAEASGFVKFMANLTDWLFWNGLWKIEQNHVRMSLDIGENFYGTLTHWHKADLEDASRDVSKYILTEAA